MKQKEEGEERLWKKKKWKKKLFNAKLLENFAHTTTKLYPVNTDWTKGYEIEYD